MLGSTQGRAFDCSSTRSKHAPVSSRVVPGRSDAPSKGYWHLCRAVGGGARGPACRAPGTIGGVWSVAIALNTRQGTFCSLCCQIYSTIWLPSPLDRPAGTYQTALPYLAQYSSAFARPNLRSLPDRLIAEVEELVDASSSPARRREVKWVAQRPPSFQLSDPAAPQSSRLAQQGHTTRSSSQHRSLAAAAAHRPRRGCRPLVQHDDAASYRTAPRLVGSPRRKRSRPGSRDSLQCMPLRASSTSAIAPIASHPEARLQQQQQPASSAAAQRKQKTSPSLRARLR